MKYSATLTLIVIVGLVASSTALPARKRMVYLQQQPQWHGAPQRMMYVQYVQPSRTHARSTQAADAFVAGESVATRTYLEDCDHAEADIAAAGPIAEAQQGNGEDALGAAGAHGAQSFAEAYPEENDVQQPIEVEVKIEGEVATAEDSASAAGGADGGTFDVAAADVPAVATGTNVAGTVEIEVENTNAKVPREYHFGPEGAVETPADAAVPAPAPVDVDVSVAATPIDVAVTANLPAPVPIAPVAAIPVRRYLPANNNKKVYVELEQSAESDADEEEGADVAIEDAEEEDEETYVAPPPAPVNPVRVPNARRPTKKATKPAKAAQGGSSKPTKAPKPLPAGTFFPIDFGGTNGGAIAIANAFSTGEGGSATSHAVAYGSPDAARARVRPSKRH